MRVPRGAALGIVLLGCALSLAGRAVAQPAARPPAEPDFPPPGGAPSYVQYGHPMPAPLREIVLGRFPRQALKTRGVLALADPTSGYFTLTDRHDRVLVIAVEELQTEVRSFVGLRVEVVGLARELHEQQGTCMFLGRWVPQSICDDPQLPATPDLAGRPFWPRTSLTIWSIVDATPFDGRRRDDEADPEPTLHALLAGDDTPDPERVTVRGRFCGRNLCGGLSSAAPRGDAWVLERDGAAVWVVGKAAKGKGWRLDPLSPGDTSRWLEVVGRIETRKGVRCLRADSVQLVRSPEPKPRAAPTLPRATELVQTSAGGDRLASLPVPTFVAGKAQGVVVKVDPSRTRQTIEGIGGSLTESSAYVLGRLEAPRKDEILDAFFGPGGADFTLTRVPVGASDFSPVGHYSYADVPGDTSLDSFSIAADSAGFAGSAQPGYDLLPLIEDALARQPALKIVASPWTAPAWMKDNRAWHEPGRRGGALEREHYPTFARYMVEYLLAYRAEGVSVWGITPVNEPLGNGGQWESMEMSATEQRDYVGRHLGPALAEAGLGDVRVLSYDHNRDHNAIAYADAVLGDPQAARYVWGTALHWYQASDDVATDVIDAIHERYPQKAIMHTEGCIDAISAKANRSPQGDFLGWKNDAWWWSRGAVDWGWDWAPPEQKKDHPPYTPVHRYARDLVVGLNHWFTGWIDWNIVLDERGGPNHVGNFAGAPVMIDVAKGEVYFTPLYHVIRHFSRYLRPGDRVVEVTTSGAAPGSFHATAAISPDGGRMTVVAFNEGTSELRYAVQLGARQATLTIPSNALQTIRIELTAGPSAAAKPPEGE